MTKTLLVLLLIVTTFAPVFADDGELGSCSVGYANPIKADDKSIQCGSGSTYWLRGDIDFTFTTESGGTTSTTTEHKSAEYSSMPCAYGAPKVFAKVGVNGSAGMGIV